MPIHRYRISTLYIKKADVTPETLIMQKIVEVLKTEYDPKTEEYKLTCLVEVEY